MGKNKKHLWQGLLYSFTALTALSITASTIMESYASTIDKALGTVSSIQVGSSKDGESLYSDFVPNAKYLNADGTGNSKAILKDAIDLDRRLVNEGSVLLKNESNALPLAKNSKVTLLGARSYRTLLAEEAPNKVMGGIVSLNVALGKDKTTRFDLSDQRANGGSPKWENVEIETAQFELNSVMQDVYKKYNDAKPAAERFKYDNGIRNPFDPKEPSISELKAVNSNFETSFLGQDAAIVVVGRPGLEATDYIRGGVALGTGASDPLELTTNERELIKLATDNFNKVIVLVNSANPMEIEELKQNDKIQSILWIGYPGAYGCLGIADILSGKVSPSGCLPDTYAVKNLSAPASVNTGDYTFTNASSLLASRREFSDNYVIEAEGIYVGYRYYETRYEDLVLEEGNASSTSGTYASTSSWNYNEEVSYPFGYGISYTNFEKKITNSTLIKNDYEAKIEFDVEVKNLSSTPSKTVVQIYGQSPYTRGGLEKTSVQLLEFEKTPVIEGNATIHQKVVVDIANLVSYDQNVINEDGSKGSYVFENGDYYFAIGEGSHNALNNILAKKGYTPSNTNNRMDEEGDVNKVYTLNGSISGIPSNFFSKSKNGQQISNHLEYADYNYYEENKVQYLSRNDWSNYVKEYKDLSFPESMRDHLNGKYYEVKSDGVSNVTWNSKETNHKFFDLKNTDYNDPRWEELCSQMSLEEGMYLSIFGGPNFPGVSSVGLLESYLAENAGSGIVLTFGDNTTVAPWSIGQEDNLVKFNGSILPTAPVIAATFSHELMKENGEFVGLESLFTGMSILWGPGINTHRNSYNGRNNEYYSEDPILTGNAAMEFSIGALKYGLIAAPKHFAFNDQETNRKGVAPFMTEQRAREVELRACQIAFEADKYDTKDENGNITKDKGMLGVMISFSKIGGVECSCSHGLLTDILRGEWGFHGYAVTDIYDDVDLVSSEIYGGITGIDYRGKEGFYTNTTIANTLPVQSDGTTISVSLYEKDGTLQKSIRTANHDLLWAFAQSNLVNRYNSSTRTKQLLTWWRVAYIGAISVSSILALGAGFLYTIDTFNIKFGRGGKKNEEN